MIRVVLPAITIAKYKSCTVTYYNPQPHLNNLYFIFMMIFKKGSVLKGSLCNYTGCHPRLRSHYIKLFQALGVVYLDRFIS